MHTLAKIQVLAIFKTGNGESENRRTTIRNGERGTGNGEWEIFNTGVIFKVGDLFRSKPFFLCKICVEMFYPSL